MKGIFTNASIEYIIRAKLQGFTFSTNRWIFVSTLTSAFLFAVTDILSLKIVFGLALAVGSGFVIVPLMECIVSFPKELRELMKIAEARRTYSFSLIEELLSLSKIMGVHLKGEDALKVAPNWINAGASIDGRIILGQTLTESFDREALKGVLAHELGHLKAHHHLKIVGAFLLAFILVVFLISFVHLPWFINLLLVFSIYGLVLPMFSWRFEYEADSIAANFVGSQPVTKGLRKLTEANNINVQHETYSHPSISNRISRLQKITN